MNEANEIKVGSKVIAIVGRNKCAATVSGITEKGYRLISAKSGKEFVTGRIAGIIAEPMPETVAAEPETEVENNTPNPAPESGKPDKPEKKMSLMDAAVAVLKESGKPMNTREMVKAAIEKGYWVPTDCQTPEQTLYGSIFREIKTKEQPRIVKSDVKGKFQIA